MRPALAVTLAFWLAACSARSESAVGTARSPVRVVLSPRHAEKLSEEDRHLLARRLADLSGLSVEVEAAASAVAAVQPFASRADVGLLSLFEYLLAREEYRVEARLQVLRREAAAAHHGEIVVRQDTPAQTLGDLKGRRVAFVDPFSSSGFVFPAALLADSGVQVTPVFAGGHAQAIEELVAGRVDAAATYAGAAPRDAGLRNLARTRAIPNEPVFFRRALRAEKKEKLTQAFMDLADDAEGARLLAAIADITGFRPAADHDYDESLRALRAAGKTLYEVVPDGVLWQNQRLAIDYLP